MFELMQKLVAFKYSCKLNHWYTTSYSEHLLFDRLQEDIDDFVDNIAEQYFMSLGKKKEITKNLLDPKLINQDLGKFIKDIIDHIEKISEKEEFTHGVQALLDSICQEFCEKQGLNSMK